jgi:hypothetical protein
LHPAKALQERPQNVSILDVVLNKQKATEELLTINAFRKAFLLFPKARPSLTIQNVHFFQKKRSFKKCENF